MTRKEMPRDKNGRITVCCWTLRDASIMGDDVVCGKKVPYHLDFDGNRAYDSFCDEHKDLAADSEMTDE